MGSGTSVHSDGNVITSFDKVAASHMSDHYRVALKQKDQFLDRETRHCKVTGFSTTAHHAQPLLMAKMERGLNCLDDVGTAFAEDQIRSSGFNEMFTPMLGSTTRRLCALGDDSAFACTSENGDLWMYNWKEGRAVTKLRSGLDSQGGGVINELCLSSDGRYLASGDDCGFVSYWDLSMAGLATEARLHEGPIVGLATDSQKPWLYSTSTDSYIMIYDTHQQHVVDRVVPQPGSCGDLIPCTCLALSESKKMVLVGGADGKLRLWANDSGPLRNIGHLSCGGTQPTHISMLSDNYRVAVGTVPADPVLCHTGLAPETGGVRVFDLRMLSADGSAHIGPGPEASPLVNVHTVSSLGGIKDMTVVEEGGEALAVCVLEGKIRAFDLNGEGGLLHKYAFDVCSGFDEGHQPCAVAASGRYVFAATTAKTIGIWQRTRPDEPRGHDEYPRPPVPDLRLRARCMPPPQPHLDRTMIPGAVCSHVERALDRDRMRAGF